MSSTNRSNARDTHKSDYYITPEKPIKEFLKHFFTIVPTWEWMKALDPCAGGDSDTDMPYPICLKEYSINTTTNDIRNDSPAQYHSDFLEAYTHDWLPKYDLIITNPPFNIAIDIIKKALTLTNEWWYVVMLLRLNFFGSKWRYTFFKENMPSYCFIHHERISFNNWPTDSIEYAHFVWKKWYNPPSTLTFLL